MPVVMRYNPILLDKKLDSFLLKATSTIEECLKEMGVELMNYARENKGYTDRSGNLKRSTGYVLFKGMDEISHQFTEGDNEYSEKGMEVARYVANKYNQTARGTAYHLVIVAGMEYAWYVENLYGYAVLANAEIQAHKILPTFKSNVEQSLSEFKR